MVNETCQTCNSINIEKPKKHLKSSIPKHAFFTMYLVQKIMKLIFRLYLFSYNY